MNDRLSGVLGVVSGSGGVGRSTVALSVAADTVRLGGRALLLDLDPSTGVSLLAGVQVSGARNAVQEALTTPDRLLALVQETDYPGLFVLPGGRTTREVFGRPGAGNVDDRLGRVLALARKAFDTVVLDMPAGTGPVVQQTLPLLDIVVACVVPEPLPVRLLAPLLEMVARMRSKDHAPIFGGICLNRVSSGAPFLQEIVAELDRSFPSLVLETALPDDPWFIEASARALPLPLLMPEAAGARAVARMVSELWTRLSARRGPRM